MRGCIRCGSPSHDLCVSATVSRALAEQADVLAELMDAKMREFLARDMDTISELLVKGEAKSLPKGLLSDL